MTEYKCGYPPPRERESNRAPGMPERFERYESPPDELTIGDALAEVFRFSGRPDSIVLAVRTNDCFVRLVNRGEAEQQEFLILESQPYETHYGAEIVMARNRLAGSNAQLNVVGKWKYRSAWPTPPAPTEEPDPPNAALPHTRWA